MAFILKFKIKKGKGELRPQYFLYPSLTFNVRKWPSSIDQT